MPAGRLRSRRNAVANEVKAYILIQTVTSAAHVAAEIRDFDGVLSSDDVSGPYDVIVQIIAENMDELGKTVVNKIQAVEGISRTLTCPVVQF
jgi:DNA-binding Lrp family transcriptional regulator